MFIRIKFAWSLCAAMCLAILASAPVTAQKTTQTVSQTPTVASSIGNVTNSYGGGDDKIYNGTAINQALNETASLDFRGAGLRVAALLGNQANGRAATLPPDDILCVDLQTLGLRGRNAPVYISSLVYASNPRSLEIGLQRFDGGVNGFGIGTRIDIAAGRRKFVSSLNATKLLAAGQSGDQPALQGLSPAELRNLLRTSLVRTANTFVGAARGPRVAVYGGYRSFNSVGSLFTAGVSASQALRFQGNRNVESASLTPLLSVEGVQFNPTSSQALLLLGPLRQTTAFVRVRTALIFQNRTFYLADNDGAVRLKGKWSYQTGLEYDFWNSFDQSNTLALFARLRVNEHFQVAAVAGTRSDKQDFIGLTATFSFKADGRR